MESNRSFRLSQTFATRLSWVLSLSLTAAATVTVTPLLHAQQTGARTDLAIQSDVLKALSSYPDVSSEHITATTQDGIVTLAGTASTDTAKNQAQVVAATVDGVRSVVNNVTVTPGSADASGSQADPEPVQQAQSNVPDPPQQGQNQTQDQNQDQPAYPEKDQPQPGVKGNWGQAGPPPDVQNGQIPQHESQQASQSGLQDPMPDPGEDDPSQQQRPSANASAGQYPQQGYPQQGYPRQASPRAEYPGQPTRAYAAPLPTAPVTIPAGTLFTVRTSEPLDSRTLRGGEGFQAVVAQDIYEGPYLAVPRGAILQGRVVGVKKPGAFRGGAGFALQVVALDFTGQSYPVATDTFATDTRGKGGYTTANTVGGAAIGALIGAVAGGGPGAAIGAAAGGGLGLGASAATAGPREVMPPETLLTFHLRAPLTVNPVSYAEMQRLQASVTPPARRVVRRRPPYGYGYPPPPPPYYYPYYPYRYWR